MKDIREILDQYNIPWKYGNKEEVEATVKNFSDVIEHYNIQLCLEAIDMMIDEAEKTCLPKYGEWIESDISGEEYRCSVCGGAAWYYDVGGNVAKSKFCPNCGAKMGDD